MRLRASRTFRVEPVLPTALEPLRTIAHNLWWTWNTDAVALFHRIDREKWEATGHNPVRLLQLLDRGELEHLAGDEGFLLHLARVQSSLNEYLQRTPQVSVPGVGRGSVIAYFSLEFALTESLPSYSGGLGVLAADHLKSASDMGLPLVGVSLLYKDGYFQQVLSPDGWQHEEYHEVDVTGQPLQAVRDETGRVLTVSIPFDGRDLHARIWRIDVGKVPLFLLDTDCDENRPEDRKITARLYGGDIETRIQQEMTLGIGGLRALRAMGLTAAVCHMNEGHSALLGVDRIRMLMEDAGASFDEARLPVAASSTFTTHTAVPAGIDLFPPDLVRHYLGQYYASLGLDDHRFLGLGRLNPDDDHEPFSMALLGFRLSGHRNGVSHLHGSVSRHLWESVWPGFPVELVPISSVTNGVHLPTWVSHELGELYDAYVGQEWREQPTRAAWDHIHDIPDEELWQAHQRQRERLVTRAREQHRESAARRGVPAARATSGQILDPNVLTVGFARRFAGYKRATLLFRDLDRLAQIVNDPGRPVQFVFAGKAHPRDEAAKELIREVIQQSQRPEFRDRMVVLESYDLDIARTLIQGCDVWLNTPLRPLEASGTSGMKAVANGALHCSVLDGWWSEAYQPHLGWAVGRNRIDDDPEVQTEFDSASLYELLEQAIAPMFYRRDPDGFPREWVRMMKDSIAAFAPVFNTNRMVQEYVSGTYEPAARNWDRLRSDGLRPARELSAWLAGVAAGWSAVKLCAVEDDGTEQTTAGAPVAITAQVHLGSLKPEDVRLDIVFGPAEPGGEVHVKEESRMQFQDRTEEGLCRYTGVIRPSLSGRIGYVVRVLPDHPDLPEPMGAGLVHWA